GLGLGLLAPTDRPVGVVLNAFGRDEAHRLADQFGNVAVRLGAQLALGGGDDAVETRGGRDAFAKLEPTVAPLLDCVISHDYTLFRLAFAILWQALQIDRTPFHSEARLWNSVRFLLTWQR